MIKNYQLKHVSKIKPSSFGGNGLFATRRLPIGTILHDEYDIIKKRLIGSYINDTNMKYPKKWNSKSLYRTILNHHNSHNNNVKYVKDDDITNLGNGNGNDNDNIDDNIDLIEKSKIPKDFIVIKDINVDDEITKKYSLQYWIMILIVDIMYSKNPNDMIQHVVVDNIDLNEKQCDLINKIIDIGKIFGCSTKVTTKVYGKEIILNGTNQNDLMPYYIIYTLIFFCVLFFFLLI